MAAAILILSILINHSDFLLNVLKPGIYILSGSASQSTLSVFMCDRRMGHGGHFYFINFNQSFLFSVKCFETWYISRFSGSASLWRWSIFLSDRERGCGGHHDFFNFNRFVEVCNFIAEDVFREI